MKLHHLAALLALLLCPHITQGATEASVMEFAPDGVWSVTRGGQKLIAGARLVVAGVGWKGSATQAGRAATDASRSGPLAYAFRGRIVEPVSKVHWHFTQRAEPIEGGYRFVYTLEPQADTQLAEASLFIDLPLAAWRGKPLLFGHKKALFPEQRPASRHFLSGTVREIVLNAGEGQQTTLRFRRPTQCTVQDTREFGGTLYNIYPRLCRGGKVKAGQAFRLEFSLLFDDKRKHKMTPDDYSAKATLAVGPVRLPVNTVKRYERLEVPLDVAGTWTTPFDPDQIRVDARVHTPSGRDLVVPAFFTQDFAYHREEDEGAWQEPVGQPHWMLRFAGTEVGTHILVIVARDKSGEATSHPVTFEVTPSDSPGYIRVSTKDRRYFAFDSGAPYFAVGENVCTWRTGVEDYDTWLPKLGRAGGNYARIWMWGHCFGIEWGKPGHYRMGHAAALDHAMGLAEQHGIYVKLCLEAWRGFRGPRSFVKPGVVHPYDKRNGGPCEKEMDVFTDAEARRMFRNRLRYCVARWGCSTHILAWEYWNEINCVFGYRGREMDMVRWSAEMAQYLRQTDPWQHLVVNSLGSFLVDDRLWKLPEMAFAQVHGYWHPTHVSKEMGKDMAEFVPHWIGRIRHYGKPALFAEYGLVNPTWGHSPRADEDTDGVHLHNGLWSSAMAGAAGTAMLWWWGNYVDPNDLYYHFAAVRKFTDGVPWDTAGFEPVVPKTSTPQLRAMALRGKGTALLWLHNRQHTWWNVVEKKPIAAAPAATVTLDGLPDGTYQVEWWDTWKGEVVKRGTTEAKAGALTLSVDSLARDGAVKLLRR